MAHSPPIVLVFAANDPTGGAGLAADLLTLAALGCHGLPVLTATTVQDTAGVDAVLPVDADWVLAQARKVLEDMPVAAFKLGVAGSLENLLAMAEILADHPNVPLVVDPVLRSGRGDPLASDEMVLALTETILPQTTLVTPNSLEARRLAGGKEEAADDLSLDEAAARLLAFGCEAVLITGTHEPGPEVVNTLYDEGGVVLRQSWPRLAGSFHGSGCTLASACAAALARGLSIEAAARDAQDYTFGTLRAAFRPGMGQYIPDRLFWARGEEEDDD